MSAVHFHVVFTHAAVIGSILGVLILVWAMLRKNHDIRTLALAVILGSALLAIPVYLTGEDAEEVAEEISWVSESAIHEHEEAAELSFIGLEVLGGVALIALFITARRTKTGTMISWLTVIVGIVVAVLVARTSNLGGQIKHPEISSSQSTGPDIEREHHDDD